VSVERAGTDSIFLLSFMLSHRVAADTPPPFFLHQHTLAEAIAEDVALLW
jgi:hypothetical protein